MSFPWKESLDESIWPQVWPTRKNRYGKINSLFDDDEVSQKQLRYMQIYLFHNKEESQFGRPYEPKTIESWADYFGYHYQEDPASSIQAPQKKNYTNSFGQVIRRHKSWHLFKEDYSKYLKTLKGENIEVQHVQAASALEGHFRVHFYNCPAFSRVDDAEPSGKQCESSMVEKTTQDYRIDREMTPVFHKLGNSSKMPSTVQVFNRIKEIAAYAARKEKAEAKTHQVEKAAARKALATLRRRG